MPYPRGRVPVGGGGGGGGGGATYQVVVLPNTGGVIDAPNVQNNGSIFTSGTVDADGWHTITGIANVARQTPRFGAVWSITDLVDFEGNPVATVNAGIQDQQLLVRLRGTLPDGLGAFILLSNTDSLTTGQHIGVAAQGNGADSMWPEGHRANARFRDTPITGARIASLAANPGAGVGDIVNQGAWAHDASNVILRGYTAATSLEGADGFDSLDRHLAGIVSDGTGPASAPLEFQLLTALNGGGRATPQLPP